MTTRRTLSYCVSLGLVLLMTGCAGEPGTSTATVPGVTDSTITLGTWGPLTGPAAPWGALPRGMETYFKMINEAGGIHGRRIRFIVKDDQYQPARTVAAVKEMVERDNVFAILGGIGTAPGMAVKDYINAHQVPWIGVLTGAHYFTHPIQDNLFGGLPLYFDEAALLADYAVTELGKTKVAVLYQNDDYGKSGLVGAQMAMEQHGMALTEAFSVELMDSDLSSQAIRLRESGADAVLLYVTPRHAANILGEASKLGFRPQWIGSLTLADAALMHTLTNGLWEGVVFGTILNAYAVEGPLMQQYEAAHQRYAAEERGGYLFYEGMAIADYLAEGLRQAGRDLTRATLIAEIASLDGYRNIGAPISYETNARHGFRSIKIVRCLSAGEVETLKDWTESDLDIEAAIHRLEGGT